MNTELEKKLYDALTEMTARNTIYWQICIDHSGLDLEGFVIEPDTKEIKQAKEMIREWYSIDEV